MVDMKKIIRKQYTIPTNCTRCSDVRYFIDELSELKTELVEQYLCGKCAVEYASATDAELCCDPDPNSIFNYWLRKEKEYTQYLEIVRKKIKEMEK
jgi:hypothetical protein